LKDDDSPNAKLFAFDVEKMLKRADYLLDQKFSKRTNKQFKGRIAFKSHLYIIFEDYLYY
jgi:hypothetical protein